ncbi:MAG: ribbon-helix-helix domain-containing protein [Thermoanaerobaculia bacterium]|nr:ribbon-helix-helix domain-containing protein [Thermoanaerobaculia bacterium]
MRTVQMTLEEDLLDRVDAAVLQLGTSRSAFTREALARSLERLREAELEARHRAGYERFPPEPGEFSDWHDEQVWPE